MKALKAIFWWCTLFAVPSWLAAQLTPFGTSNIPTKPWSTQGLVVPPSSTSSSLQFTADPSSLGGDIFDIVVDNPALVIGLTLPSGTQVNVNNAGGLGYQFSIFTAGSSITPNPFAAPGTHTLITMPAGASPGTYVVTADSTSATVQSLLTASYYSSSFVTAGLTTDASNYRVGDLVVLTGLLFDATGPIANATVTASVAAPVDLSAQVIIGNYQLVSQQSIDANTSLYTYTASLSNSGAAIQGASADATSNSTSIIVQPGGLYFGNVDAGANAISQNAFAVQATASQAPDLSVLQWAVQMPGAPISVALADSGSFPDAVQGDGLFSGAFTPLQPGEYLASISASGTSLEGIPFSRVAVTDFTVVPSNASLGSISDQGVDTNGDGLVGQVVLTATVSVQKAGTYLFSVILQASNGQTVYSANTAALTAGSQTIAVQFEASDLLGLGVSGPYEKTHAYLALVNGPTEIVADLRADAGPTGSYTFASLDRGLLYFTDQNSASGVITGAGTTYDLLRVQIGVFNASASQCSWSATLADALGNSITSGSSSGFLQTGGNSIAIDFNGPSIAAAGSGPYSVVNAGVICGTNQALATTLFTISGFSASQFTYTAPDFALNLNGTPPSGPAGSSIAYPLQMISMGAFSGRVFLTVSGLPAGSTGSFSFPSILGAGLTTLTVTTPATLSAGTYPFTLTYSNGTVSKTLALVLSIQGAAQTATPTFSPTAGAYSSAQTVIISTTTSAASIRYTTDGSMPTETIGTLYVSPITVGITTTIKAIAYANSTTDSAVASATYTIAPAQYIWVADAGNDRLAKFDLNGNYLSQIGPRFRADYGTFNDPEGIAIDANGNIYVADTFGYRVQKFDSSGNHLLDLQVPGIPSYCFFQPWGIAVAANGNTYITDDCQQQVVEFDSGGNYVTEFGTGGSGTGQFSTPAGITVDSSGNVYVADSGNSRIEKFSSNGSYVSQIGAVGLGNGQFQGPQGIAIDNNGAVYVVDQGNARVQKFDSNGNYLSQFNNNGQFFTPTFIDVDPSGAVYVTDGGFGSSAPPAVYKFDAAGDFLGEIGTAGTGSGQYVYPQGITHDPAGNTYIVDGRVDHVQKFGTDGSFTSAFGAPSTYDTFDIVASSAVDASGNIYVLDNGYNFLSKFDSNGNYAATFGMNNDGSSNLCNPTAVALDASNNVYITDGCNARVVEFDSSGNYLNSFGTSGSGDGQFQYLFGGGMVFDSAGNIYVTDEGNCRVQKFDANGNYLSQFPLSSADGSQSWCSYPAGLMLDGSGNFWVTDPNGYLVVKFDPSGNYLSQFGSVGSGQGQFGQGNNWPNGPMGIGKDSSRNIYIVDSGNNRVQKFDSNGNYLSQFGSGGSGSALLGGPWGITIH